jgi:carbon storage regulator CsrA
LTDGFFRKGCPRVLVLSRRLNEKVVFPDINATVQVVEVRPGVVRLGIVAPRQVSVMRGELLAGAEVPVAAPARRPAARTKRPATG